MHKCFGTPTPTSLYVENGSGTVRVDARDVGTTTVQVSGKQAEETLVEHRGEQVVVIAPKQRVSMLGAGPSLSIEVTLPAGSRVATRLGSADLQVTGRIGETTLRTGSGGIRLDTVDGEAEVEAGSGGIAFVEVTGDLRVKAGSGDVSVQRLGGAGSVSTGSGEVEIGEAGGDVRVKTGSGSLRVRRAHGDVSLSTASGDVVVDLMHAGELVAKNVSGDVRVGVPEGLPVWADVSTVTGTVSSDLEGAGQPADGEPFLALRARTVSGGIYLEQR